MNIRTLLFSLSANLLLLSCGGNGADNPQASYASSNSEAASSASPIAASLPASVMNAIQSEKSEVDQELKNSLAFMGNEERLAYDIYNALYVYYPNINQLTNIASKSEFNHISAVQLLVRKYINDENEFTNVDNMPLGYRDTPIADMQAGVYDIQVIQTLYDALYAKGIQSERDALEVGCMVEVTDVNDLEEKLNIARANEATDVETVFQFLLDGSYNHYWAFDRGLKNRGISSGCCSLGTIDGVNYCHDEYPK